MVGLMIENLDNNDLITNSNSFFLQVSSFTVSSPAPLGKLFMIEVEKQVNPPFPEASWFLSKVKVKSPEGETYNFPVHRWISSSKVHQFREAKGL